MNIIFFSNPDFFGSQKRPAFSSMPRFTNMLAEGMEQRGHKVSIWSPGSQFFKLPVKGVVKKYMGYIDQYFLFPLDVKRRLKECPDDTLFVFTDQAQGPWIPLVSKRNHVMHCHDFLAQWSALGLIEENKVSWTGRKYQRYIRNGYDLCKNFISGSYKTNYDLQKLTSTKSIALNVVYNGLDQMYQPVNTAKGKLGLANKIGVDLSQGYFLHVGGNQWYKNRKGVLELYVAWRKQYGNNLPLIMIGADPSAEIYEVLVGTPFKNDVHFISGLSDAYVRYAYSGATAFLFPSFAEGFGWPIAEAMGCGCPVVTTNEAPMTEVAGDAAFLLDKKTAENETHWASDGAKTLQKIFELTTEERVEVVQRSLENVKRFDADVALNKIESIYTKILVGV
ncbi:MAG: glycosyltransferase [Phormidesmis sp. FL-bin-119]|nr:glycosyltransferase [Pedobacter sp.]